MQIGAHNLSFLSITSEWHKLQLWSTHCTIQ